MRILLAVPRYDYGKPANDDSYEFTSWLGPLKGLGHDVELFDTFGPQWGGDPAAAGRALLETATGWRPDLVLMLLLEDEIGMGTVDELRRICPVANWFSDDTWRFWAFSRHLAPHFTWVVTTSRKAKRAYDRMPGVRACFSPWGYDPVTYHPVDVEPTWDVGFVGQRYGHRGRMIEALRTEGFSVTTRGSGWPEGRIESSGLARQFASARINLSFLESSAGPLKRLGIHVRGAHRADRLISKLIPPPLQLKARPFEVTACGAFLLTNVVPELLEFFDSGKELATFDSETALRRAVAYYLEHEEERRSIAAAGLARAADYSWPRLLERVLDWSISGGG